MGTSYHFECPECGEMLTSSEGKDRGFIAVILPMICKDCKDVVQVLIGREGIDGPSGDPEYDKKLNICPQCEGKNLIKWKKSHPCPKCGTRMFKPRAFQDLSGMEVCESILWD